MKHDIQPIFDQTLGGCVAFAGKPSLLVHKLMDGSHDTLNLCRFNVGPTSETAGQQ